LEDAEDYFEKELGMDDSEAEDRLNAMGYDSDLPDDKVRLVENPKKFIEEYIESLMNKKTNDNDLMSSEIKEINPIVKKQIKSLKNTMNSHNLSIDDIIKHLKDNE
jgi:phosphoribosyl-ATP pyrophosphohydrolase